MRNKKATPNTIFSAFVGVMASFFGSLALHQPFSVDTFALLNPQKREYLALAATITRQTADK